MSGELPVVSADEALDNALKTLYQVDMLDDRDRVTTRLEADFQALRELYPDRGELYPHVPTPGGRKDLKRLFGAATLGQKTRYGVVAITNSGDPHTLQPGGVSDLNLSKGPDHPPVHGRLALPSNWYDEPYEDVDGLLHFLSVIKEDVSGKRTVIEEVESDVVSVSATDKFLAERDWFEDQHEGFNLGVLNAADLAMIALQRKHAGDEPPLSWTSSLRPVLVVPSSEGTTKTLVAMIAQPRGAVALGQAGSTMYGTRVGGIALTVGCDESLADTGQQG